MNQADQPEYHVLLGIFENFFYENIEEGQELEYDWIRLLREPIKPSQKLIA
jgi:hypothetical protein